jgi:hypothetical protein
MQLILNVYQSNQLFTVLYVYLYLQQIFNLKATKKKNKVRNF